MRGVLFDIDGTLIDSNDANAQAWVEVFREQGYDVIFEKVRRLVGMGGDNLIPEAIHIEKDSPEGKAISKRRGEIVKAKVLPQVKPFPQAKELLLCLHGDGKKLVAATSAKSDEADALLDILGVRDLFEKATSDDAKNSKPDPDIVQAALDKAGLSAQDVLMVGDTPYDIQAAQKAGVRTIALRCGGWADADLVGAVAIYNDPADLLVHYETSPLKDTHR